MNARHLIREVDFALRCQAADAGLQDARALERLLKDVLLPLVEQAFDACDEPGRVLVLPVLAIDLGNIPRAGFEAEAGRRLHAQLLGALAEARRSAAQETAGAPGGAAHGTLQSASRHAAAQLAAFLATGRLPWHADLAQPAAHVALLDRLLAAPAEGLPAMLATALAHPCAVRRLAEQFPVRQLHALLQLAAPERPSAPDSAGGCDDALHLASRLRAALLPAPSTHGTARHGVEVAAALATFLRTGRVDPGQAGTAAVASAVPVHVQWLEHALAGPADALRALLQGALAHPDSARRLVEQFAPAQLAALVRCCAPARADALLALTGRGGGCADAAAAWRGVLGACVDCADPDTGDTPGGHDLDCLAAFLCDGAPLPSHVDVLERLAAGAHDGVPAAALRDVLARVLRDPRAAGRLARQFPTDLLVRVARTLAPHGTQAALARAEAALALAVQRAAEPARLRELAFRCWQHMVEAAIGGRAMPSVAALHEMVGLPGGSAHGDAGQGAATPPWSRAELPAPRQAGALHPAEVARLSRLAAPGAASRVATTAPAQPAMVAEQGSTGMARERTPLAAPQTPAAAQRRHGADAHAALSSDPVTPNSTAAQRLLAFLATGRLDEGTSDRTHVALLDALLAAPAPSLWPRLAAALTRPACARRLVEQFPERQWHAVVRLVQPARFDAIEACALAASVQDATPARRRHVWQVVLRAAAEAFGTPLALDELEERIAAIAPAGAPGDDVAPATSRLVDWLGTGDMAGAASPAALVDDAIAAAPDRAAFVAAMTAALAAPAALRRLVAQVPQRQLDMLLWFLAPTRAAAALDAVAQVLALAGQRIAAKGLSGQGMAELALRCRELALTSVVDRAGMAPAVLHERLLALAGVPHPAAAPGASAGTAAGAPATALARLAWFLASGTQMASAAQDGAGAASPVALLDGLLAAPTAALWAVLAGALARPGSGRRLVEQFPQRQLAALARLARPDRGEVLLAQEGLPGDAEYAPAALRPRWRALLAALLAPEGAGAGVDPAALPGARFGAVDGAVDGAMAILDGVAQLQQFLQPGSTDGVPVAAAVAAIAHLQDEAPQAVRQLVAGAAQPDVLRRLARHLPQQQLLALVAPEHTPLRAAADDVARMARGHRGYPLAQAWQRILGAAAAGGAATPEGLQRATPVGRVLAAPQAATSALPPWRAGANDWRMARAVGAVLRTVRRARDGLDGQDGPGAKPVAARVDIPSTKGGRARFAAWVEGESAALADLLEARRGGGWTSLRGAPGGTPADVRATLAEALDGAVHGGASAAWRRLLADRRPVIAQALRQLAHGPAVRAALARRLPEALLADLVEVLQPEADGALRRRLQQRDPRAPERVRRQFWCEMLAAAVLPGAGRERALVSPATATVGSAGEDLLAPVARPDGRPRRATWPDLADGATWQADDAVPAGERLALINAGLVLTAPYLPRLFGVLGLVADGRFIDTAAAERAVHLLQFAASGQASSPEYQLPLNKLVCGLAPGAPVPAGIAITDHERDTIGSLLQAIIGAWSALGKTSVDGFRQAFLLREGSLLRGEQDWRLTVAPGPFDMLMDRLPWSFSLIRYPWMPEPVHVTWQRP